MPEQEPSCGSRNRNEERRRRRRQGASRPPGNFQARLRTLRNDVSGTVVGKRSFGNPDIEAEPAPAARGPDSVWDSVGLGTGIREFGNPDVEVRITGFGLSRTGPRQRPARSETRRAATQRPRASRATARWQARADRGARLPPALHGRPPGRPRQSLPLPEGRIGRCASAACESRNSATAGSQCETAARPASCKFRAQPQVVRPFLLLVVAPDRRLLQRLRRFRLLQRLRRCRRRPPRPERASPHQRRRAGRPAAP